MSSLPKVNRQDIRKIIFDHFKDTDVRFSNDEILEFLNQSDKYKPMDLDVLDFEDILLEMENSGILRGIAQNFNTRYYRLWATFNELKCGNCGQVSYHSTVEEPVKCPSCKSDKMSLPKTND